MDLKQLLGYSNRRGNGALWNFRSMLMRRLRRWTKHDEEAHHRVFMSELVSEYDWANDIVKVHVVYDGRHVFTITDPDDHEQMQALVVTMQLLE